MGETFLKYHSSTYRLCKYDVALDDLVISCKSKNHNPYIFVKSITLSARITAWILSSDVHSKEIESQRVIKERKNTKVVILIAR